MYKALNNEDVLVGYGSVIEPFREGSISLSTDQVDIKLANSGGSTAEKQVFGQIASIINGDSTQNVLGFSTFRVASIKRNTFKDKVHVASFTSKGNYFNSSSVYKWTESGPVYKNLTGADKYLLPEVGLLIGSSISSGDIKGCSEEIVTVTNIFVRVDPSEFNYSTNPSFSDVNENVRFPQFVDNPKTYITTIGFYNDNGDCLAVAKLSKPLKKDFTKEALIRVKLDF